MADLGDKKRRMRRAAGLSFALLAAAACVVFGAKWWVEGSTKRYIYRNMAALPARPIGIVFGAKVYPGGRLSTVLRARVDAGIALYRLGKVKKLLMTGDNGTRRYDEVTAMKDYAVAQGVPAQDVVRDYAGFRTYDSCYRARRIFQVTRAVLVTQAFHLPRAVYLARAQGIDAVGFTADDRLFPSDAVKMASRERLSVVGAVFDAAFHRPPKLLGRVEPVFGDDSPAR